MLRRRKENDDFEVVLCLIFLNVLLDNVMLHLVDDLETDTHTQPHIDCNICIALMER